MKENSISIPAFVICLDREVKRRQLIQEHLHSHNIAFTFSNAVDGRTLTYDEKGKYYSESSSIKMRGRPLAAGEIGCYLSHSRIWEKIISENINKSIIIESDALFTHEAVKVINAVDNKHSNWELIMLHYRDCYPAFMGRLKLTTKSKLVRFSNKSSCATAYMVTLQGAKKLIKQAYPIQLPVDDYMTGGYINKNITTYAVYPKTVNITDDALETSTIREDLFPMMKKLGIKRRTDGKKKTLKELEKNIRRFIKKTRTPPWL